MKNLILSVFAALAATVPAAAQTAPLEGGLTIFFGDAFMSQSWDTPNDLPAGIQQYQWPASYGLIGSRSYNACFQQQIGQGVTPQFCDFWGAGVPFLNIVGTQVHQTRTATGGLPYSQTQGMMAGYGASAARLSGRPENIINLCHPAGDVGLSPGGDITNQTVWSHLAVPGASDFLKIRFGMRDMLDDMRAAGNFGTANKLVYNGNVFHLFAAGDYGVDPVVPAIRQANINYATQAAAAMNFRLRIWVMDWCGSSSGGIGGPPNATFLDEDMVFMPVRKPDWDPVAWASTVVIPLTQYDTAVVNNWIYDEALDLWDTLYAPLEDFDSAVKIMDVLTDMGVADSAWEASRVNHLHSPSPMLSNYGAFLIGKEVASRIH